MSTSRKRTQTAEHAGASASTPSAEEWTEHLIRVRQVTHVQASWTERERGEEGDFTLQLILDNGVDEYVLRPDSDDLEIMLRLFKISESAQFDLERKVLMFNNLTIH
jgi:hypothetical protein